ncbi:MAG: hypothetical protein U0524_03600 [Candidatus Saccharimonadales bacterium]
MEFGGLGDVFGAAIGAAEAAGGHFPDSAAVEAVVVDVIILLQRFIGAVGANTALVEPISISVEAIFDMIFADGYIKIVGDFSSFLPGVDLQTNELKVCLIIFMLE